MTEATVLGGQEVVGVGRIEGPILIVEGATNVSYDEVVEIRDSGTVARTSETNLRKTAVSSTTKTRMGQAARMWDTSSNAMTRP